METPLAACYRADGGNAASNRNQCSANLRTRRDWCDAVSAWGPEAPLVGRCARPPAPGSGRCTMGPWRACGPHCSGHSADASRFDRRSTHMCPGPPLAEVVGGASTVFVRRGLRGARPCYVCREPPCSYFSEASQVEAHIPPRAATERTGVASARQLAREWCGSFPKGDIRTTGNAGPAMIWTGVV